MDNFWIALGVIFLVWLLILGIAFLKKPPSPGPNPGYDCYQECPAHRMQPIGYNSSGCYCQNHDGILVNLYGPR